MKKLTELAINRPLLITVAFTILILFGIIGYKNLNYNLLPKFDANVVSILATYRGASAEEIENTVTKQIEDAVSSMEGIDKINSSSLEGASIVVIQLKNGVNTDKALNDAQRKVNQIKALLPKDLDDPVVNKFSSDDIPVLRMGITAHIDDKALYDLIDLQIKPQLSNIQGVGQIALIGGNERQLTVNINQDKLQSYGLQISQISNIIAASSLSTPAGKIETHDSELSIKFDSKFNNADQLRNMAILKMPQGGTIYLKDIAEVVDGQAEVTTINHINGQPSIGMQVLKQTDANAVEVSKLVRQKLEEIAQIHKDIQLDFQIASDQSIYTLASANAVMKDIILAIIIVSLIMLLFLHSMRSSSFVLVALPASMIPTFMLMNMMGMSLNLMTLMALSLVVGILVDDSIVILENIMRHMEMGKNKRQATIEGRAEIGFTAVAITSVDVVVFFPMALVSGLIGNILREFALVVVFSTLLSLLVCFTLTPLLASRWGKVAELNDKTLMGKIGIWFEKLVVHSRDTYTKILKWSLHHKRYIFGSVILMFVGTGLLFAGGFIGFSFISQGDQGELIVKLELDPTATVFQTNKVAQEAEDIILAYPEVTNVFSNIGYSGDALTTVGNSNYAELNVKLVDKEERNFSSMEFGSKIQNQISQLPGVKVTIAPISLAGDNRPALMLVVKGNDRASIREYAEKVMEVFKKTPGVKYPEFSTKNPKPEIEVQLDRDKIALFGLNAAEVGMAIGTAFRGNDQAKYNYQGNEYKIMVKSDDFSKSNIDDVRNLLFTNAQGQPIRLDQFANVRETMGESVLQRSDRLASITVQSQVEGRAAGTVGKEIEEKLQKLSSPTGISWGWTGQMENQKDAFGSLLGALGLGILLVYLIMVALYENAVYPFVVLFALPLATIGAFLALALSMKELTIFAMIGLIMLMGLVAKNGILLVDFTNQRKAEGASLIEALVDAGRERYRPILMTTIAMIFGMMPIALASGSGAEVKNGMAWVIIGGLTSSLLLTLVVVPCVYYIVDSILNKFRRRRRHKLIEEVKKRQYYRTNPS